MLISRQRDDAICVNHHQMITVHEFSGPIVLLYLQDMHSGAGDFHHMQMGDRLEVGEYGTELKVVELDHGTVTFEIERDPKVIVHRAEGWSQ